MRTLPFLSLCLVILLIPITLGILIITVHSVFAQTPTATTTIQGTNNLPNSLQFIPQRAIITTLPPQGENVSTFNTGGEGGIVGAVIGGIGLASAIYTNITKGKNIKQLADKQVQTADINLSQSKQFYDALPEYGNKLNGAAPETRLEVLQKNKEDAVKLASKV